MIVLRRRIPALAAFLLLILTSVAATLPLLTPDPRSVSTAEEDFSAARAIGRLDHIAKVPHPTGSAAQKDVRTYLQDELRALGLTPEALTRVAARDVDDAPANAGTVTDIHATIPGKQSTGRILLVAHYDSVPTGPGAADDGANVAAILEIAGALKAGPQLRNDVEVLFTEGEENGLLGAQAFVDAEAGTRQAAAPERTVVINMEARGVSGPAVMFQMAGAGLTSAVRASGAFTTSLADEVYRLLPHDTDLTVFDEAGMRGLNFAFMGGSPHYHTDHDDIARLDPTSVQDMGDSALGAVRQLGGDDLAGSSSAATYFSLFGTVVSYPAWLVLPLAVVALLAVLLLLRFGRRAGLAPRRVGRAAATFPLTLIGAAVLGVAAWWVLAQFRPDFVLTAGSVYHLGRYAVGETLLLLVLLVTWYRWARRKASPLDVTVAVLCWFTLLAVVCAVLLPGAAYLFTWPALIGLAAVAAILRYTAESSPWRTVAGATAAVPAVVLVLPVVLMLLPTLGLSAVAVPLVLAAFVVGALLCVVEPLPRRRVATAVMLTAAVTGAATLGVSAALDGYSADEPKAVSLGYVLESDTDKATWVSLGGTSEPTVSKFLDGDPVRYDDRVPPLSGVALPNGEAKAARLDLPRADDALVTEDGGVRTVRMRIKAPADSYSLAVYADTSDHEILGASVEGTQIPGGRNHTQGTWGWGVTYAAPPADGLDIVVRARGEGPLPLRVVTSEVGLPDGVGAPAPDADQSWAGWPSVAGQTFVVRTFKH
ncbi:M20/M25/M40 family metallo-hydrolase [Streptomyces sp. NBC_01221]|uniref:M20/M25/M40 family metallo-hydrolase n=1 Tax=Streptomyces sp. NBC_01221 TaxID=2903782 RepID=UPI00224F01B6|nr:M20/M25/M40 family metallo-hydrolase [Streptomyces sp. NBC_01221]MCX4791433.1 M20/M25/M40 family metallo-hydrolase [Streptomyces sp. NBC_01221]